MSIPSDALPSASRSESSTRALNALREIPALEVREAVELRRLHPLRHRRRGRPVRRNGLSPDAFAAAVELCRRQQFAYYILGDGSNVIVSDEGFRGLILRFVADNLTLDGNQVIADAGASLASAGRFHDRGRPEGA